MRRQYIDIENSDTLSLKDDTLAAPAAGEIAITVDSLGLTARISYNAWGFILFLTMPHPF